MQSQSCARIGFLWALWTYCIQAACSALVESIEAGDGAWFERVVSQLREVLAEQRAAALAVPWLQVQLCLWRSCYQNACNKYCIYLIWSHLAAYLQPAACELPSVQSAVCRRE